MNVRSAINKINMHGALLVFPIQNSREPKSLWYEFFPRTPMKWQWDEDGDDRVSNLWILMKKLSDTRQVVYTKWYQGRATFFSRELFEAMLCLVKIQYKDLSQGLSLPARSLLEVLEGDSPLSSKELKKRAELQGKYNAPNYNRGMKDLFTRLLIVGFGEVDDGFFPSLAVGTTQLLYEDLWLSAAQMDPTTALHRVDRYMPAGTKFRKYLDKTL